jgi:hypothetical protein
MRDALFIIGTALNAIGLWMVSPVLSLIFTGLTMVAVSLLLARTPPRKEVNDNGVSR